MRESKELRKSTVSWMLFSVFGIVFFRLTDLAILQRSDLVDLAHKQQRIAIEVPAKRGEILDRTGSVLATSIRSPSVYAIPRLIADSKKNELAGKLASILKLSPSEIEKRLRRDKAFIWLKRKVSEETAKRIQALGDPNVQLTHEPKRYYPHGSLTGQLLGLCDIDDRGIEGIELAFDSVLRGKNGIRSTRRDALGHPIAALEEKSIPPVDGHHLILTIDQFIQHVVERELDRATTKWRAKGGSAVAMDPRTGEILALAVRPALDPNHPKEYPEEHRRNRAITDSFEPGSIFKIVTLAAAYNEGSVTLEDTFDCEHGEYHFTRSRVIHDVHPYGMLTFSQVLIKSSNIGTVKVGVKLGEKKLHEYIKRFGFGEPTGIEVQGEVRGKVRPLDQWSKISISSIPYGQEIAATPLQMLRALAVIANGGRLIRPKLVKEVYDPTGIATRGITATEPPKVLEEETARVIREILVRVIEEGTGQLAKIKGIKVGGKTGTAQKVEQGTYSHSHFISSFMGFAPAEGPVLAMIFMVDDPRGAYYGGVVAAPAFKRAMEEALLYLGIVPNPTDSPS